ncbi:MAG: hypothetical protein ABI337_06660 [Nitrososphaera sp.]
MIPESPIDLFFHPDDYLPKWIKDFVEKKGSPQLRRDFRELFGDMYPEDQRPKDQRPEDQSPQDQNQTGPEIQRKRGGPYSKHVREVRRKIIQEHIKFNPRTNEYYVENKSELARLLGVNRHTIEADIKAIEEERLARFEEALRRDMEARREAYRRLKQEDINDIDWGEVYYGPQGGED